MESRLTNTDWLLLLSSVFIIQWIAHTSITSTFPLFQHSPVLCGKTIRKWGAYDYNSPLDFRTCHGKICNWRWCSLESKWFVKNNRDEDITWNRTELHGILIDNLQNQNVPKKIEVLFVDCFYFLYWLWIISMANHFDVCVF